MNSKLKTGKRILSVFMAVLMVMTAWVFVAPEAKAATAGNYTVKVELHALNGFDNKGTAYVYINGQKNNGKGDSVTKTLSYGDNNNIFDTNAVGAGKDWGDYKTTIMEETVDWFPMSVRIKLTMKKVSLWSTDGKVGFRVFVYNNNNGSYKQVMQADTGTFSANDSIDKTLYTGDRPSVDKITWTGDNLEIKTTPNGNNASAQSGNSATVYDQYGVEWYQEPNWVVTTTNTAKTSSDSIAGVSGSSGQDKGIVYANRSHFNPTGDGTSFTCYYNPTLGGKVGASKQVTIYNTASITYKWYTSNANSTSGTEQSSKVELTRGTTAEYTLSGIKTNYGIDIPNKYYTSEKHYYNGEYAAIGSVTSARVVTMDYKLSGNHVPAHTDNGNGTHKKFCDAGANCGYVYNNSEAHEWVPSGDDDDSTCVELGKRGYRCSKCTATKQVAEIPKKDHLYKSTTNFGNFSNQGANSTHQAQCINGCGQYGDDPIACTFRPTVPTPAQCGVPGVRRFTCEDCGGYYEEVIPALEHKFTTYVADTGTDMSAERHGPWCEINGTETAVCDFCHTATDTSEIPNTALDHDWQTDMVIPQTCYQDGLSNDDCARCGRHWDARVWPKEDIPHTWGEWVTMYEPKCETEGRKYHVCQIPECQYREEAPIDSIPHLWGDEYFLDWPATCEKDNQLSQHCTRPGCDAIGHNAYSNQEALGHAYQVMESHEATCYRPFYELKVCQRPGCTDENSLYHTIEDESGVALGHNWVDYVHDLDTETCTTPGTRTALCTRCSLPNKIPDLDSYILDHDFQEYTLYVEADPTQRPDDTAAEHGPWCDFDGTESSICARCNNTEEGGRDVRIAQGSALGHDVVGGVSLNDATCTKNGHKQGSCQRCGGGNVIGVDKGTALGHDMTDWSITLDETCTTDGSEERHCTRNCGEGVDKNGVNSQETRVRGKLGHDPLPAVDEYRNGQTSATCILPGEHSAVVYCGRCSNELVANSDYNVYEPPTGHTAGGEEQEGFKAPTCQTYGSYYMRSYCTNEWCDVTQETESGTRHFMTSERIEYIDPVPCVAGDWVVTKQANCYHSGSKTKYCIWCKEELKENRYTIPQREHTFFETYEAPTCYSRGRRKIVCEATVSEDYEYYDYRADDYEATCEYDQSILGTFEAMVPHQKGEGVVDESTVVNKWCERPDSYDMVYYCVYCNTEMEREAIIGEPLPHTPGEPSEEILTAPSCTAEGSKAVKITCTRCHTELSRDAVPIPANKHIARDEVVIEKVIPVSCTKDGSYDEVLYCKTCDKEFSRTTKIIEKLGHVELPPVEENRTGSTCGEAGSYDMVVYCDRCKKEVSREHFTLELLNHEAADEWTVTVESTCYSEGTQVLKCKNCDYIFDTKPVEKKNHNLDNGVITAATCQTEGYTTYTCQNEGCGYTEIKDQTEVIPHAFNEVVTAPNCITEGYTTCTCTVCGYSETKDPQPKTEHQFGQYRKTFEGTCTRPSIFSRTCPICNRVETKEGELGSCVETVVKGTPATCDNAGLSDGKVCSECGKVFTEQTVIPALGHKDDNRDHKCDHCGGDYDEVGDCSCICHKTNFLMKIVYAIVKLFWKLFKISKTCYCGIDHY